MNKKKTLILLMLLVLFVVPTADAKKKIKAVIRSQIITGSVEDSKANIDNSSYSLSTYYLELENGTKYPAFCIEPDLYVYQSQHDGKNNVTCEKISYKKYPRVYSLIGEAYDWWVSDENKTTVDDTKVKYDIMLRLASVADRINNKTIEGYEWLNYGSTKSSASRARRAAFYNAYYTNIISEDLPYKNDSNYSKYSKYKFTGTIANEVMEQLKEVETNLTNKEQPTNDENTDEGKLFKMELVEEGEGYTIYKFTSDVDISSVEITTSDNTKFEWVTPWDKREGVVKFKQLVETDCEGSVSISGVSGVSDKTTAYLCRNTNTQWQDFIAYKPGETTDEFKIKFQCKGRCDSCEPAKLPTELKIEEIHNCCDDESTTKLAQYALDELFCKYTDHELSIEGYKERCNAEEYITDKKEYCTIYCSYTTFYRMPGPTKALADRAFKFTKLEDENGNLISGPLLNQFKRCRIVIKFDEWYENYNTNVTDLVKNYNDNQENLAYKKLWEELNKTTDKETIPATTISCTNTYEYEGCDESEKNSDGKCIGYEYASDTLDSYDIRIYKAGDIKDISYAVLELKEDKYKKSSIELKETKKIDDSTTYYDDDQAKTYIDMFNAKVDSVYKQAEMKKSGGSVSCSPSEYTISNRANPTTEIEKYKTNANIALVRYNQDVIFIKKLKDGLDECGGKQLDPNTLDNTNIDELVKFEKEPEMEFSYVSIFKDDTGKIVNQEVPVSFTKVGGETENTCVTEIKHSIDANNESVFGGTWAPEWDIVKMMPERYETNKYKQGIMTIDDMVKIDSNELDVPSQAITKHKNETYYAPKKFTSDAVNHMTCKWVDLTTSKYVLVPNGFVYVEEYEGEYDEGWKDRLDQEIADYENGIAPKEQKFEVDEEGIKHYYYDHYVRKTSASGKFETYFTLKNVADGKMDDVIHQKGETCSGDNAGVNANGTPKNLTCYIHVESEYTQILDCNRKAVISAEAALAEKCDDPGKGGASLYLEYKEVDPAQLFPNEGNYGWNWKVEKTGKEELQIIQQMAKEDKTYAPENMTYSFTLNPSDLRAIREYNKSRIEYGGYQDFNMNCDLSGTVAVKCKSKFIDAISGGNPLTYGSGKKLALTTNNMNLDNVRSNWKETN